MLHALNDIEKFEHCFPFHLMRVDQYEGKIKRFVTKSDYGQVSMDQIMYSFNFNPNWIEFTDEHS